MLSIRNIHGNTIPPAIYKGVSSSSSFIRNLQRLTIAELIELYAYAEAIVETVREPLIVLNDDLTVKSVNKGFLDTFKVTSKESLGRPVFELGNGQWNIPALIKLLKQVLPQKKIVTDFEVDHIFPAIGQRVMLLNARTIILSQYRTRLILLAIEDVTERKINEARTEKFIDMASHELKTPITSIMAFMHILERKLKKGMDTETSGIMSRVLSQLNILNDMIRDLFDVRKMKQGTFILSKKQTKVMPVIREAITLFGYIAPDRKIVLEGDPEAKASVDSVRLTQVITNLLQNAVKHSQSRQTVRVTVTRKSRDIVIAVRDSGRGIRKSQQKSIFDPYVSMEKDSAKKGLGMGLYISKKIMEMHGGSIWVDSTYGKGSTFYISFPAA